MEAPLAAESATILAPPCPVTLTGNPESMRVNPTPSGQGRDGHSDRFLDLEIRAQPDDVTCGPTSLHAVYSFFDRGPSLEDMIGEIHSLKDGGTLAAFLGIDSLKRGFSARIYSYDLKVFDPSWAGLPGDALADKLRQQLQVKKGKKFRIGSDAYLRFLELGGEIAFDDLNPELLDKAFDAGLPILTGLNATYLYGTRREFTDRHNKAHEDDLRGGPVGHFVVLCGRHGGLVRVADPYYDNPMSHGHFYDVPVQRLIRAILLGVITYDANLLVLSPDKLP